MEILTLALFCAVLLIFVIFDASVLYALGAGLVIFSAYALIKKHSFKSILKMIYDGMKTSKNVLIVFLIVGMLTASWRASGTIPFIISSAVRLINPNIFVLMTFLLCCGVSFLMGTSFGSAATIGVICMTMAYSMNINPVIAGGAMLSGVLFGDRCSPVSTSALLVSELTKTDIFTNIKKMFRTAFVPFILTCIMYITLGFSAGNGGEIPDLSTMFSSEFNLHWASVIPAVVILVLSLLRVKVRYAMLASIASALVVGLTVQGVEILEFLKIMILGFKAETAEIKHMIDGGGLVSMLKSAAIVCLSSAYSGIFSATGLLHSLKEKTELLSKKITPFGATMITSIFTSLISCNQTLAIILTHQLCEGNEKNSGNAAIDLENSAVVISPLVPWSIAGAVPLASAGAPTASLLLAGYLYILPIFTFIVSLIRRRKEKKYEQNNKLHS